MAADGLADYREARERLEDPKGWEVAAMIAEIRDRCLLSDPQAAAAIDVLQDHLIRLQRSALAATSLEGIPTTPVRELSSLAVAAQPYCQPVPDQAEWSDGPEDHRKKAE